MKEQKDRLRPRALSRTLYRESESFTILRRRFVMTYRFLSAFDADNLAAAPLDAASFASAMRFFEPLLQTGAPLGLAISGGPDSMALALCLLRWQQHRAPHAPKLQAFLVDHRLRPESAQEAQEVQERLAAQGLPCEILVWTHDAVQTRIHVEARAARYRLLAEACRRHATHVLAVAHQAEDQAETVLERLAKGSGTDGLAGIAPQSPCPEAPDITLIRPLLAVPRARLTALCDEANVPFVTDPSNSAEKYARGRLRRVMPLLEAEGLTCARLLDLAARAAEDKEALAIQTDAFLDAHYRLEQGGVGVLDRKAFLALPAAIAHRALDKILRSFAPSPYPVQRAKRARLLESLAGEETLPPRSLNGVLLSARAQTFLLMREATAIRDARTVHPGETLCWDHRWQVSIAADFCPLSDPSAPLTLRKLGTPSRAFLDPLAPTLCRDVPQSRARAALPALWQGDALVGLPSFGDGLSVQFVKKCPLPTPS